MNSENKAEETAKRYLAFSDVAFEGLVLCSGVTFTEFNRSTLEIFGYTEDLLHHLTVPELIENGPSREEFTSLLRLGTGGPVEFRGIRSDRTVFPLEVRIRTLRAEGSDFTVIAFRDLTAQKISTDALRENYLFLQKLMDSIPAPVFYKDSKGIFAGCNQAFLNLTGYTRKEIIGHKKPAGESGSALIDILSKGDETLYAEGASLRYEAELRLSRVHQTVIYKSAYFRPDGRVNGVIGVIIDITELKVIQDQFRLLNEHLEERIDEEIRSRLSSEKQYKFLFNQSSDGIIIQTLECPENTAASCIKNINTKACELLGYSKEEIIRLHPSALRRATDAEIFRDYFKNLKEKGSGVIEISLRRRDGTEVPVEISSSVFDLDGQEMVFSSVRDITERLRFEEEKQAQDRMLIQQSKLAEIGEMMGSIAHQWKQPLNIIGFMIQDLEESYKGGEINTDFIKDFVRQSMDQIRYMSATIEDFRKFFKPGPEHSDFLPETSIGDMLRLVSAQMRNHTIETSLTVQNNEKLKVNGPENEFRQVILNLINNSKDAISDRRAADSSFAGRIDIRIMKDNGFAVLHFQDNGGGISESVMESVFQPYVSTKGEKGTGIGLYMARQIIEKKLKGTIDVINTEEGACFIIRLPLSSSVSQGVS